MFIVSRKSEESVIVDGFNNPERELKVTVLEVKNGRVKLGFEVNADVAVLHPQERRQIRDGIGWGHATTDFEVFGA